MPVDKALARQCLKNNAAGYRCEILRGQNEVCKPQPDCGGKSLIQMIWDELDQVMDRLLAEELHLDDEGRTNVDRGRAHGLAISLSILLNPYNPSIDTIRAEAMERWNSRNA